MNFHEVKAKGNRIRGPDLAVWLLLPLLVVAAGRIALGANIDPNEDGSYAAYGENIGWVNLKPSSGAGVTVDSTKVTGQAWGENVGWITLPDSAAGVKNDGFGRLSGYAWGENIGWINFGSAPGQGVTIDSCGDFAGKAWGENIGWISFRSDDGASFPFKLTTSWRPPDIVPPATSAIPTGSGWQKTDVAVALDATDNACGAGVKELHYWLDFNTPTVEPGSSATLTVASEGQHSLQYFAIDNASNTETQNTLLIQIDKTPPVLSVSTPGDGATYFINQSVPASYTATDTPSGIASLTGTVPTGSGISTATPGANAFMVSATDAAGNTVSTSLTYSVIYPGNVGTLDTNAPALAWGENVGWINFKPSYGPGVTVTAAAVTGKAWGENIGWITLGPFANSVVNDGAGHLSGYAWAENAGWINFSGVTVDAGTGAFKGAAWGENIGWITFDLAANGVTTSWGAPAAPVITWNNPADIVYGTALGDTELNATASVPGTFVYTPASGTVLDAGNGRTLSADFTPTDTTSYTSATKTVQINVLKADQTISFAALGGKAFGDPAFDVSATATSSLPVSFAAAGSCTIAGSTVSLSGVGTCTVTAYQAGDTNYNPAPDVPQSFSIAQASPVLIWANPGDIEYGMPLSATQLNAAASMPGTFVYTPPAGTILGLGLHQPLTVLFTPADAADYTTATLTVQINVRDTTPPAIGPVSNLTVEATSPAGAVVSFSLPAATDAADPAPVVTASPASGGTFPLGTTTVTVTARDAAGNTSTKTFTVTVQDTTLPGITITSPANGAVFALNQAVAAAYSCTDISGVTTCTGPVPSGSSIDTSSVGAKNFIVTARDNVGNTTSLSHTYSVLYNFTGFFQPVDNPPAVNGVNSGRAIPVKFSLGGNQGLDILAASYPKSVQSACNTWSTTADVEETVTAGGSSLSFDPTSNQYIYVWKTDRAWASTCRQFILRLKDGTDHLLQFQFKK